MVDNDDCAMIKHINDAVGGVTKHSDIGHAKRSLGSKLYGLKSKDKTCTQLSAKVIKYCDLQKMPVRLCLLTPRLPST